MSGRLYRLEARDATGVFLGLSLSECVLVGLGFAVTVGLRLAAVPVLASALPLLAGVGVAKIRVAGRPVHQWLGLVGAWCTSGAAGRRRWRASHPLMPARGARAAEAPPILRGMDIVAVADGGRTLAAVRDRRRARLTAVLPVRGSRFAGNEPSTQDSLLSLWGDLLAACGASGAPVVQVGWSHQALPATLEQHREWLAGLDGAELGDREDYDRLTAEVAAQAACHETVVWVTVAGTDAAGRGRLLDRAAAELPAAVETVAASLRSAGLTVDEPLPVAGLWRLLRRRSDPFDGGEGEGGSLAVRMGVVGEHNGHALAVDTAWSELQIDGSWHRVYWVEAWPRRPVAADWLSAFLAATTSSTMTVLYRPVELERSRRRIDSQLVKLGAHRARKEEKARRITEVDRRTEEAARELEAELASGYAEMQYLGLVCVSAASRESLDAECRQVEHAASTAQLGLRVLHGRQDAAWAAALPIGAAEPGLSDRMGL